MRGLTTNHERRSSRTDSRRSYLYLSDIDRRRCGGVGLGGFTSGQDPNKLFLERSVSEFDISQVLQFSYISTLPFGLGKRFGNNCNYFVATLLGAGRRTAFGGSMTDCRFTGP